MKNTRKISTLLSTAILITILLFVVPPAFAEETPVSVGQSMSELLQYEWHAPVAGNAHRDGFSAGPAPDRPEVLWRSDLACPEIGEPYGGYTVAFNGNVFTRSKYGPDRIDALVCLDAFTGETQWIALETELQEANGFNTGLFSSQAVWRISDDHIMIRCTPGAWLAVFDANNGDYLWEMEIDIGAAYHRTVIDFETELLYAPYSLGDPYNYDVVSAWDISNPDQPFTKVWEVPMQSVGDPMLCAGDGKVFMGCYSGFSIVAYDAHDGSIVWETPVRDYKGYAGTYYDGKLFAGCAGMYMDCFDAETGELLWTGEETGAIYRGFMVWNIAAAYDRVYAHNLGAGTDGFIGCWDVNNGDLLWKVRDDHYIGYHQIVVADGKVYAEQSDGSTTTGREPINQRFACIDAYTGDILWTFGERPDLPPNRGGEFEQPAIAYGNLYIKDDNGNPDVYYCLSTVNHADWNMWRGNVNNPGVTPTTGPKDFRDGPAWTFEAEGAITSSPVLSQGKLVIGSHDMNVYCLDAFDGSMEWKYDVGQRVWSTPAIVGNKVIIGPDNGNVICVDLNSGTELWSTSAGGYIWKQFSLGQWQPSSSPIIYKNRIYVGAKDGLFRCLDLNGNVVWSYDCGVAIFGSAAIEDNEIYIQDWDNIVHVFNMAGTHLRQFQTADRFPRGGYVFAGRGASTPVVVGDVVYMGVMTAQSYAYDANTGDLLWYEEQPNILGENAPVSPLYANDPVIEGARVYCPAGPTEACFDAETGVNIWTAWGGWEIFSSLAYAGYGTDPVVYGGSQSYSVTCWNASNGYPLSWFTTGGQTESSPAVYAGNMYIGSADWNVYCFSDYLSVGQEAAPPTVDEVEESVDTVETIDNSADETLVVETGYPLTQIYAVVAITAIVIIAAVTFLYYRKKQ
jgi:outer membrane protein assembly factor BamB